MGVKHQFVCPVLDSGSPTKVGSGDWNAEHILTGTTLGIGISSGNEGAIFDVLASERLSTIDGTNHYGFFHRQVYSFTGITTWTTLATVGCSGFATLSTVGMVELETGVGQDATYIGFSRDVWSISINEAAPVTAAFVTRRAYSTAPQTRCLVAGNTVTVDIAPAVGRSTMSGTAFIEFFLPGGSFSGTPHWSITP